MTTFFRSMLRSDSPESFGRFSCFLIVLCLLVWSSVIVALKTEIPAIPAEWVFLVATLFGVSKGSDALLALFRRKDANPGT